VKVRDVTAFAKLVDELLAVGGVEFSSIDAGLSNEKELEDTVWERALSDAHERAEKTLKAAGMKIDSAFAISPVTFPQIRSVIFGELGGTALYAAATERAPRTPQYRLPPITVTQNIHVIYLISPAK
jgi:uncharacterized protein YggE